MEDKKTKQLLSDDEDCIIYFFPSGCGDAIWIRYKEKTNQFRNILIDSGYTYLYKDYLSQYFSELKEKKNENVDLWCITHVDTDHINGILSFMKDKTFSEEEKNNLVSEYWFNSFPKEVEEETIIDDPEGKSGIKHGTKLRDYLLAKGKLPPNNISSGDILEKHGSTFEILAPIKDEIETLEKIWKKEEATFTNKGTDYKKTFEELKDENDEEFEEDESPINKSSISFIWSFRDLKILFLGDSVPSSIYKSLIEKKYSEDNKLKVDFVKISHHGSGGNTSSSLLKLIDCDNYVICADGLSGRKHELPYKQCLVRILTLNPSADIYFSCEKNGSLEGMFTDEEKSKYQIKGFLYPNKGEPLELEHSFSNYSQSSPSTKNNSKCTRKSSSGCLLILPLLVLLFVLVMNHTVM